MSVTRKLLRFILILGVLSSGLPVASAVAGTGLSVDGQIEICVKGRDLLLQTKYEEAKAFLEGQVREHPDALIGYFGLMSLYQIRNLENFDFRFDAAYQGWEEKGRAMALRIARAPEEASAWDLLMAGGTLGISGFYRAHNTKWFAALRDASLGFHTIERAYRKDPQLSEALLGVGLYDYWRSYFARKLLFLPFFADRREEGKQELGRAQKESRFASVLAEVSLAFIDLQEKSYAKVIESSNRLLSRYPQNIILRMMKGKTLIQLKKYSEAIQEFDAILKSDPSITKSYLFIGIALAREGKDPAKAKEYVNKFLEAEPSATREWKKSAEEILKDLEKKSAQPEK